jgi:tripartite-type tricarboxylate transporter receptor subunit TctC
VAIEDGDNAAAFGNAPEECMRKLACCLTLALSFTLTAAIAPAQTQHPNKTVKILVPYAPGGLTDVVARLYADQLRKAFGQNVLVENKPGASGIIAIEEMARAKPDGYTLMIGNISTNALTPVLLAKRLRIDYDKDVQIVARLADTPVFFMATTTNFPPKTFDEFIAYAKAHPGDVRYASAGIGAYQHVNTEILAKRAGLNLLHIPYKDGGSQILHNLANGDAQVSWFNITNPIGMMKAGRVRALAVASDKRLPNHPDVPTLGEVGYPGMRAAQWTAAFAPAGVPRDIIEVLHKAFSDAAKTPEVQEAFQKGGNVTPPRGTVDDARTWLKDEMAAWRRDIADINLVME